VKEPQSAGRRLSGGQSDTVPSGFLAVLWFFTFQFNRNNMLATSLGIRFRELDQWAWMHARRWAIAEAGDISKDSEFLHIVAKANSRSVQILHDGPRRLDDPALASKRHCAGHVSLLVRPVAVGLFDGRAWPQCRACGTSTARCVHLRECTRTTTARSRHPGQPLEADADAKLHVPGHARKGGLLSKAIPRPRNSSAASNSARHR
jgi:hypothetical protein